MKFLGVSWCGQQSTDNIYEYNKPISFFITTYNKKVCFLFIILPLLPWLQDDELNFTNMIPYFPSKYSSLVYKKKDNDTFQTAQVNVNAWEFGKTITDANDSISLLSIKPFLYMFLVPEQKVYSLSVMPIFSTKNLLLFRCVDFLISKPKLKFSILWEVEWKSHKS